MTAPFTANIDKAADVAIPSEGQLKGRLEGLNLHNCREFTIYPPIPGFAVPCSFPEAMYDEVHQAVNKNVTVFGILSFKPGKALPERVQVKRIEINPDDKDLPKLSDFRGTWAGGTDGLTTVEFLRTLRDG